MTLLSLGSPCFKSVRSRWLAVIEEDGKMNLWAQTASLGQRLWSNFFQVSAVAVKSLLYYLCMLKLHTALHGLVLMHLSRRFATALPRILFCRKHASRINGIKASKDNRKDLSVGRF